jgi:hypothetical protein
MTDTITSTQPSLAQQLATLDAELFANIVTTTHANASAAVAQTLVSTAAPTLELAQQATAPLVQQVVAQSPVALQPLVSVIAPAVIQNATTSIFNWLVGAFGGSQDVATAKSAEAAGGTAPNSSAG